MVEHDLGEATIVYDDPDDGPVELTVENEHVAYFQDHWIVATETHDDHDVVRRIPAQNVYYVERSVEEFEESMEEVGQEVTTVADEVERELDVLTDAVRSFTDELPLGFPGGGHTKRQRSDSDVTEIDIEEAESNGGGGASDEPGESDQEDA